MTSEKMIYIDIGYKSAPPEPILTSGEKILKIRRLL